MSKCWFITGCSSGLGRALAEQVLARGDRAVVTARDPATIADLGERHPGTALMRRLDVTDPAALAAAFDGVAERLGPIDVLVNNAAYILNGAVEETGAHELRKLMETNFFGPAELMRRALGPMRARGRGHVINISSMAAMSGIIGFGSYAASKAALVALSEAAAEEVRGFGIAVTVIELGGHATKGSTNMVCAAEPIAAYADTVGARQRWIASNAGAEMGDAELAAKALIAVADADAPPRRIPVGRDAVERNYAVLEGRKAEIDRWRALGESTVRDPAA